MLLIAHRGNIGGKLPDLENTISYVMAAIAGGFNVEVDVWKKNDTYYLGHDEPKEKVGLHFLLNKKIWCHAKNANALQSLLAAGAHCFWHQKDDYTITSEGFVWAYPGQELIKKAICVLPEKFKDQKIDNCSGICSDFVLNYLHLSDIIITGEGIEE